MQLQRAIEPKHDCVSTMIDKPVDFQQALEMQHGCKVRVHKQSLCTIEVIQADHELHGLFNGQMYLDVCSQAGDQIPHGRGWPVEVGHVLRRSTRRAA
jgi:hypothetical protein